MAGAQPDEMGTETKISYVPILEMCEREIVIARAEMRWSERGCGSEFEGCLVATMKSISEGEGWRELEGDMKRWAEEEMARICG